MAKSKVTSLKDPMKHPTFPKTTYKKGDKAFFKQVSLFKKPGAIKKAPGMGISMRKGARGK
jgi:hypothetical protein